MFYINDNIKLIVQFFFMVSFNFNICLTMKVDLNPLFGLGFKKTFKSLGETVASIIKTQNSSNVNLSKIDFHASRILKKCIFV